jgi:hypothetical protein
LKTGFGLARNTTAKIKTNKNSPSVGKKHKQTKDQLTMKKKQKERRTRI